VFNYRYQEQRKCWQIHIRENYPELIHVGKSKVVRTDEDVICRFNDNKKTKWADIQRVLMETGI
jgi:hypothetical protein